MAKRKTSSRKRSAAPPLDRKPLRQRIEQARQAHAAREGRMDKCEKYIRCWQTPPETLFDEWLEWCVAEEIDSTERLDYLGRPLKNRLKELIGERQEGWDADLCAPKGRDLYRFYCWDVFDYREPNALAAQLVTYLEDVREELWRRQRRRSTWRVAEREWAEAVVVALRAIIREAELYISGLTGDEPECDSRIKAVYRLLRQVKERLNSEVENPPRAEREGRPVVGPQEGWPEEVVCEVHQRLEKIRPWKRHEDNSEIEHRRILRRLSEKIVERLGIRSTRGIGPTKPQRPRPPSNPRHAIAHRLCDALGVQRLPRKRNRT